MRERARKSLEPREADEGFQLGNLERLEQAEAKQLGLLIDGPVLAENFVQARERIIVLERRSR